MKNKLKLLNFKLLKDKLGADIFGAYKSAFHGTGMEFAEHKEYVPGDEIRHIDWKVSARTNKIYIKKYEEERNLNVLFLINLNNSFYQFPKKLQTLTETFFILGASAINNNDNIATFIGDKFLQRTKSIHILARTNKIYIKKYEEERNLNVLFLIDLNNSFYQFPKKLQTLTETFFILGASAINNNDNIATFIGDKFLQRTKSIHILAKTIEEIENKINPEYELEAMLYKIKAIKDHLIFILTDEIYQDKQKYLRKLNIANEVIYINIFEHFENYLENLPGYIDVKEQGEKLLTINLENKKRIKKYQLERLKKIEKLEEYLTKARIGYVYIDTNTDPYTQLFNFFRKRILAK